MRFTLLVLFFMTAALVTGWCPVGPGDFEESYYLPPEAFGIIEEVSLPCSPTFQINVSDLILDWSKDGDVIYSLRGEEAIFPHAGYKGRVSVLPVELKNNSASLRLSVVNKSDEGAYCCCVTVGENTTCSAVVLRPVKYCSLPEPEHRYLDNCPQCPFVIILLGISLIAGVAAVCFAVWLKKKKQTKDKSQHNELIKEKKPLVTTLMFTAEPQIVVV